MSTYRDDLEAALARNHDLERKVRELEERLAPMAPTPPPPAAPSGDDEIARLVAARDAAVRAEQEQEANAKQRAWQRAARRRARRPQRVTVTDTAERRRITIRRRFLRDGLAAQAFWGGFFAAINPGIFIVMMLGGVFAMIDVDVWLAIPVWLAVLFAINVVYARFANRTWYLDLTANGHFALHTGNPRRAALLGRASELLVDLPEADPSRLHEVEIGAKTVEDLTDRDILALDAALRGHVQIR
jgi:hypothetical protein